MRHRVYGYKLNRDTEHRTAMFRNLAAGLFEHGQIETTLPKAKAVQPFVERIITLAKRGDLHARRLVISMLQDRIMCDDEEQITRDRFGEVAKGPKLVRHIFENVAPNFSDREGGYTRIVKLAKRRLGDGTDLVVLQLVGDEFGPEIGGGESRRRRQRTRRKEFAEKALAGAGAGSSKKTTSKDKDESGGE
ncbi:MAG: 50S ribosomal protein L17 [Phycisphaerales bacterium]